MHSLDADLTDVAAIVPVAVRVVPRPVEHPQQMHAVLVAAAVVRFVQVPVVVGDRSVGRQPAPVALALAVRQSGPEIAMPRI